MIKKLKNKLPVLAGTATLVLPTLASASGGGGVAGDITTALTETAGTITGVLGSVAPIALGIAGVFLAWRYGMRFFKSLSK